MAEALTAEFGGEERRFLLLLGGLRQVEAKCDKGSAEILHSLARCLQVQKAYPNATLLEQSAMGLGDWRVDYIREPILQGLIGGGMSPNDAGKLVRTWIDERGFQGLVENAWLAWMALGLGWSRPAEDDAGESEAEAQTAKASPPGSTSPTSTAPEPPWDGPRPKSTQPGSGSSPQRSPAGTKPRAASPKPNRQPLPSTTS